MKNDLNNIDEIFKNSFENFESNVDPSVWTNVQQGMGSGGGTIPTAQQPIGAATSSVSKSLLFYAAASIVATATIIGSVYLLNSTPEEDKAVKKEITETIPTIVDENSLNISEENNNDHAIVKKSEINSEESVVLGELEVETQRVEENTTILEGKVEEENITSMTEITHEEENNTNSENVSSNNNSSNSSETSIVKKEVVELKVSIKTNIKKGKAPLDVEFGVNGNGVSYLWDFGDNSSISSEENPYHTFKEPGTYKVTLTAIDKEANPKTSYQLIVVEKNSTSHLEEVQNVFSPNGDGINDIIKVEGKNITKFHAVIMDSKGNLIYEWDSIDGFWDGRDNGNNMVQKGTYYLVVTAVGEDGEQHPVKKSIQLY